jgi:hypothetical protein
MKLYVSIMGSLLLTLAVMLSFVALGYFIMEVA